MWAQSLNEVGAGLGDEVGGNSGGESGGADDSGGDGFAVPLHDGLSDIPATCAGGHSESEGGAAGIGLRGRDKKGSHACGGLEGVAVVVATGKGEERGDDGGEK